MARQKVDFALPATMLLGLLGIFLVPWFVPREQPVFSASYTLGFNNFVASLAFAALLAALFVQLLRRPGRGGGVVGKIVADLLSSPGSGAGSRSSLIAFGVMTTLTVAFILGWYTVLPYITFGEFGCDVSRLDLMVLGLKPYRDFQYNYGPAMLYPAYWLYLLCGGRLSVDGVFCATLLMHWVAGLSLLYYTVRTLCGGRHEAVVFSCAALAVFNFSMGVAYTPLRFIPPIASLLFLHRTFGRWVDNGTIGLIKSAAAALLLSLGSLALSPEIGAATVAGITMFFAALFFTPLRRFSGVALAPVCALGIMVLVFSVHYADGIFSFGGGANNFPVFPTLPILLHVAAGCLILPVLGVIGVRERNPDGALALALVVGLGLLIPAAFGRCDQGHVLFNGLGIQILFLALAVRMPNGAAAALMVGAFIGIHPIVGNFMIRYNADGFRKAVASRTAQSTAVVKENEEIWRAASGASGKLHYGKLLPFRGKLTELLRYETIGTPFYPGEVVDRFIKLSGRYYPEYYAGSNMQVYTPAEVSRKIRDLGAMNIILVPKNHDVYPIVADEASAKTLSDLLFFPARLIPKPRRRPYYPGLEVLKFITDNFTVVDESRSSEIWRRNSRRSSVSSFDQDNH